MRSPDLILILFTNFLWFLVATCLLRALVRRRSDTATQRQAEDPLALEPTSADFRAATAAAPDLAEWPSITQDAVATEPLGILLAAPLPELDEPDSGRIEPGSGRIEPDAVVDWPEASSDDPDAILAWFSALRGESDAAAAWPGAMADGSGAVAPVAPGGAPAAGPSGARQLPSSVAAPRRRMAVPSPRHARVRTRGRGLEAAITLCVVVAIAGAGLSAAGAGPR